MAFELQSRAFSQGEGIPSRYTCEGEDISPELGWSGAPEETRSFVVLCDDPDAPGGVWHHWAVFDIPADTGRLEESYPTDPQIGQVRQAVNDFGRVGYGGPCPPPGHGPHHYHFRVLALSRERLDLPSRPKCPQVKKAAEPHLIGEAELIGLYERSPPLKRH